MAELPVVVDLVAYRGDTWTQGFRFTRGGAPVDLTDASVESEARSLMNERTPLVVEVDDPTGGHVFIRLPAESLPVASYFYDVEITEDGVVTTWVKGELTVERDVTNELPA